jgi:GT2 family glycosyltransferase
MKRATGGIICTLSTDVRVEENLSHIFKDLLKVNPKRLIGGIKYDHDTGWNTFEGKTFPYIEGWLLATGKEQWEELAYFDERYGISDFEDVHLSTLAASKGYELYAINSPKIRHLGAQTYGYTEERKARTEKNREIFRSIWMK